MFVGAVLLYIVLCLLRSLVCFWLFLTSTSNLHNTVCERVLRAEILFFDSNPIGRIVTRFSKDIAVLDFMIPVFAIFIASGVFRTLTVAITVGVINPYLFIAVVVAFLLMIGILRRGQQTMQDSQRLDGILRGPIHTTFAMIIGGLVTLRSFDKIRYFKQDFNNTLEKCANATYCYALTSRWIGLRLDFVCVLFTVATTAIAFA